MDENIEDISKSDTPVKPKGITIGAQKHQGPSPEVLHLTAQVSEIGRKVRIMEERYSNLRRKTQITDQNMLSIQKNLNRETKAIDSQLNDLQKSINDLNDKMLQILKETENFASGDEIKVLKRYLDFWQPLRFLTKDEAEKLVEDMIKNRKV